MSPDPCAGIIMDTLALAIRSPCRAHIDRERDHLETRATHFSLFSFLLEDAPISPCEKLKVLVYTSRKKIQSVILKYDFSIENGML